MMAGNGGLRQQSVLILDRKALDGFVFFCYPFKQ